MLDKEPTNNKLSSSETNSNEKKNDIEKLKKEKANFIGAKSLLVFLKNTKDKGPEFQKKILEDVFKRKNNKKS